MLRIRRCKATAFYQILDLSNTCNDTDIKKAYRKLSLLTHPDKNGHEHADEAFKMVSRAFGVLGDKEKRQKFDRFGTDPDSRFESARAQATGGNPFAGFAGRGPGAGGGGGGGMWGEDDISPEEMFQRFFGGGFGERKETYSAITAAIWAGSLTVASEEAMLEWSMAIEEELGDVVRDKF